MSVWDLKIVTDKYCVLCILSERKLNDSAIAERFDRHLSFSDYRKPDGEKKILHCWKSSVR